MSPSFPSFLSSSTSSPLVMVGATKEEWMAGIVLELLQLDLFLLMAEKSLSGGGGSDWGGGEIPFCWWRRYLFLVVAETEFDFFLLVAGATRTSLSGGGGDISFWWWRRHLFLMVAETSLSGGGRSDRGGGEIFFQRWREQLRGRGWWRQPSSSLQWWRW